MQQMPMHAQILHRDCGTGPGWPAGTIRLASPLWTRSCTVSLRRSKVMIWILCAILVVLWALGMATAYTVGGLIHLLLVIALVMVIIRLFQGRRIFS